MSSATQLMQSTPAHQGETSERHEERRSHQIARMQWSLILFILMGQCSFFVSELYEYHFINESKTWSEAQSYCRQHYTDLATVSNMADTKRLHGSAQNQDGAWIGLYCIYTKSINTWRWSLPGEEYKESTSKWSNGEPNDNGNDPENCVLMRNHGWFDVPCTHKCKFMCYDGTRKYGKLFHFIDNEMTWPQAQNYCREHHTDLVSGVQQLQHKDFQTEAGSKGDLWIVLFREVWKWSDGSNFSFSYWDPQLFKDKECSKMCALSMLNGKWSLDECNKTKPFFCYDDKVILIKEKKTWEGALDYCGNKHSDLVSITNLHEQRWVQERAKKAGSP
ncbi:secretory phospholipase A2 receptor-like [Sander lucioperca]|uniref:secretory phospholipase A2 receptor-like n=1 Tax=Sander lucioperca TaxID=283035 RepID=UPI00125DCF56|nr:secretory phospholipase A2 receptor-like [Sander lucioperca]